MKEIKFRVWDNFRKKFAKQITTFKFDRCGNINLTVYLDRANRTSEITEQEKVYTNEFEIIQYTGLKDINGVEIYEGDIVKWGHLKGLSAEIFHRIAKVELFPSLQFKILFYFDAKNNCVKKTDGHIFEYGRFSYKDTHKYLEVIGNIYENKELLND